MASAAAPAGAAPEGAPRVSQPLLPVRHRGVLTIGIMGAMIMQILDTTIANVALPHMETSLAATADTVTWVLTSYIVATAIALPATGWLSDRLGSRNLFLISVGGFILASMACGTAVSLEEMVLFRVFQGVFAAFINPLSQTSMLDINPPEHAAKAMSIWGMGVMVGPIMGPVIGGWLTESYNWRWVFYVNVPVGALTFAILWFLLPSRPRAHRSFDWLGFMFIGIAVAAFQLMLDRGQNKDWFSSWEIVLEGMIAAAFAWMAIVHLATAKKPLFDRHLFGNRNLVTGMFFMVVIGVSTMAPMALLPPMLQQLFNYPVIDTGMMMAPRGVGVLFTMWFAGRLMTSGADTRWVIMLGLVLFAVSLRWMAGYTLEMDFWPVITAGFVQGLGMGLVFMPMNALAFATLDNRYRTDGASMLNLMRSIGQSAGISMVTVLLARNIQVSHADLVQHVTQDKVPAINLSQIDQFGSIGDSIFSFADAMINQQAAMVAYIDDFYLMSWISIAAIPLVLLLKRPRGKMEIIHAE
ncbi:MULTISPECIES: DHA2 family efflux MFS transporter permease subunit [unclassified Sphingomonas]|uniref:DHA2 family efflux MFS transporter permease subunit n=1 Tax=unclassified Sphingomonas TaxID=196159 RepID=UPI0009275FB3|nr:MULTISPECIES: DHA2 family efflux MFS transporter permease subunit [unclassified Sphingomonas]MBN8847605.1 DHA2 family efflux MFS transporter permease subunit [Sphingomonas sp.]OJV31533.1 MAG: EmrB/QacA family drug resistance transporter [Sphingomonas sp. 67-36]